MRSMNPPQRHLITRLPWNGGKEIKRRSLIMGPGVILGRLLVFMRGRKTPAIFKVSCYPSLHEQSWQDPTRQCIAVTLYQDLVSSILGKGTVTVKRIGSLNYSLSL